MAATFAEKTMSEDFLSLVRVFKAYDADKSGRLNYTEFKNCLEEATGYDHILRTGVLPGGKESICLKEFLDVVMADWPEESVEKEIENTFDDIDADKDGFITQAELSDRMGSLDHICNKQEVESILKSADVNNDGKVSLDEFKSKMLQFVGMAGSSK